MLKAIGTKQTSEFGDGFLTTAGHYMKDPDVKYNLKKIWIISLPKVESIVIYDGSRKIVEVKTSELDQVSDLFSPKEFGQLLARPWLNGWDANDAKKLAEEFDRKYKSFRAHVKGRYSCGGYFPEGDVIIDSMGAKHIIERHILEEKWKYKSKFKYLTADMLLQMLKETIETGEINCDRSNPPNEVVLEKYYSGLCQEQGKGGY